LFEKPDLRSRVLRGIQKGDKLTLIARHGAFFQVKKKVGFDVELIGFIEEKVIEEKSIGYKIKRAIVSLNGKIFTKPDISSSIVSDIREGDKVVILNEDGEFYRVKLESNIEITGYVEKDLFALKRAIVSLKGPMFTEPDFTSVGVCELFEGDKVIIVDELEKYYHVKLESDRTISGYIGKELLTPPEVNGDVSERTPIVASDRKENIPNSSNISSTNFSLPPLKMGVKRPGLLSFTGYFYKVVGWLNIIGGVILIILMIMGISELGKYGGLSEILAAYGWVIAIASLLQGWIGIAVGNGVLKGSGVARVFATIFSIFILFTLWGTIFGILFLIGLYGGGASDYFDYCKKNK
jgi:hypothetical protein